MLFKPLGRGFQLVGADSGCQVLHLAHAYGVEKTCGRAGTLKAVAFVIPRSSPHVELWTQEKVVVSLVKQ